MLTAIVIVGLAIGFFSRFSYPLAAEAAPGPVALPGAFELEDYTSFSDTTRGNSGKAYRNDDVDIQRCYDSSSTGACYTISWIAPGEWLGFDVTVANGGAFTFATRVAAFLRGGVFHYEVDGVNVTGPIQAPATYSLQRWTTVTSKPVAIAAGVHTLRLVADGSSFNVNNVVVTQTTVDPAAQPTATPTQEPTATPTQEPTALPTQPAETPAETEPTIPAFVSLPGTFEAEHYTTYSDTTPGNLGKKYRNDDVDIEDCADPESPGVCYNVAWVKPGEWLGFEIDVAAAGSYTFATRVASPNDGRSIRFEIDGVDLTGQIAVPNTGDYQAWTTITSNPVALPAGKSTLRLVADGSSFNLNKITVAPVVAPAPAPAPVAEPAPLPVVNAPVYYVSPAGDDNADGSEANPWRTLTVSMKRLRAGDTLLVRGGAYRERVEVRGESVPRGRQDARITVKAYPGEEPLVVGIFWVSNADYWTFDNIDVTWDTANTNTQEHMVRMYGGYGWIYQNSEIYGARSYAGFLVNGKSTGWLIANNYIHDTVPSNALSQDHLIYISDGSDGIVERNLLVGSPNGRGVKLGNPEPGEVLPANVIVRYNTIVNSGSGNIGVSYDAHDNQIYGNIMVNPGDIYYTVHAWYLTGANNVVRDNVAFGSKKGVTKSDGGLVNGGNLVADPMFDANYKPTNPALYDANGVLLYGHLAGTTR